MFSFLSSAFHSFFSKHSEIVPDYDKADFLADELVKLEVDGEHTEYDVDSSTSPQIIPRNTECFQRTGK